MTTSAAEKTPPRRTEYMSVREMLVAQRNPKGHDGPRIRRAIERFGFIDQPVLDERTGRLVSGHGRLEQLRELLDKGADPPDGIMRGEDGDWLWPVTRGWASRSDVEAETVIVTLNRLAETGGWSDLDGLAAILEQGRAVDDELLYVAGYTEGELDTLLALTQGEPEGDESDEDVLNRTSQEAWPRISCQVPPDVAERWRAIPGADDADRVMAALRCWERHEGDNAVGTGDQGGE